MLRQAVAEETAAISATAAVCEPLVGAPVALVPALDEGGDPVLVRRETWPVSNEGHRPAADKPAADYGAGAVMLEALLSKQQAECPRALKELEKHGRKTTHWIWPVFPTELCSASEPPPATSVTTTTANSLLRRAPRSWRQCLEKVCKLIKPRARSSSADTLAKVFPSADRARIKHFVRFWRGVVGAPRWLKVVLDGLNAAAGPGGAAAEPGVAGPGVARGSTPWLRGLPLTNRIVFQKCPTEDNKADGFAKELTGAKLAKSNELMLGDSGGGAFE